LFDNRENGIEITQMILEDSYLQKISLAFGPHHFLEVEIKNGKTLFRVGATHHGFEADASEVSSELERIVEEIRQSHPEATID
jgi:hypothetical protein